MVFFSPSSSEVRAENVPRGRRQIPRTDITQQWCALTGKQSIKCYSLRSRKIQSVMEISSRAASKHCRPASPPSLRLCGGMCSVVRRALTLLKQASLLSREQSIRNTALCITPLTQWSRTTKHNKNYTACATRPWRCPVTVCRAGHMVLLKVPICSCPLCLHLNPPIKFNCVINLYLVMSTEHGQLTAAISCCPAT